MKKRKTWAVMCGAVRDEFEMLTALTAVCDLRNKGLLEGIVISTWKGEIDRINGLREKITELGIFAIEAPMIEDKERYQIMNLSYLRQALQLYNAVKNLPDDVFVLKMRTDTSVKFLHHFMGCLTGELDLTVRRFGNFKIIFNYKIAVIFPRTTQIFMFCDMMFYGHKSDIFKLCVFESPHLLLQNGLMPDDLFFCQTFLHTHPIVQEYFRTVNNWFIPKLLIDYCREANRDDFVLPRFLNAAFAAYYLILYTHFVIPNKTAEKPLSIAELFSKSDDRRIVIADNSTINDYSVVEQVVENRLISPSKGYELFKDEMLRMANTPFDVFSSNDFEELKKWIEGTLKLKPEKVLRGNWLWSRYTAKPLPALNSQEIVMKLFGSYFTEEDTEKSADFSAHILKIIYSKTYTADLQRLIDSKNAAGKLDELILMSCARSDIHSRCVITKSLALGLISEENQEAAFAIISRYTARLLMGSVNYKSPPATEELLYMYYYLMYAVKFENSLPRCIELLERFTAVYEIECPEFTGNDYAGIMLELAASQLLARQNESGEQRFVNLRKFIETVLEN